MPDTPLNPDGVLHAMDTLMAETDTDERATEWAHKVTTRVLEGYFAVAQPEVNSVEELDALPEGAVVRGGEGELVAEKVLSYNYQPYWVITGDEVEVDPRDLIPARVLDRPEVNDA